MCTTIKHLNSNIEGDEIHCVGAGVLSDRLLNALQTSVVFFDADGTVFRTNNMARKDLHLIEKIEGLKLFDLITIVYRNDNILPELISCFDDVKTEQVVLPQDSLMGRKDDNIMFFATGCISRLDCGKFLFSFRNVVDEMTQEYMIKMALGTTRIFPWFYDFERGTMIIDPRYFDYTGIPTRIIR